MKNFLYLKGHSLNVDLVLAEYQYPILFTCIDEEKNMYLATCFYVDAEKREYLIAETSPLAVKELLMNKRTIRDSFPRSNDVAYIATFSKETDDPVIEGQRVAEINPNYLPTEGIYMDAEDDEFSEEISIIDARIELQKETADAGLDLSMWNQSETRYCMISLYRSNRVMVSGCNEHFIEKNIFQKRRVRYA